MRSEGDLTMIRLRLRRVYLHWKSLHFQFFVPLIVLDVILPLLLYSFFREYGIDENLRDSVHELSQFFLPIFSNWWVLFILREYVESDGNELLYVCKSKCKLPDCLLLFAAFMLNTLILFAALSFVMPGMMSEYVLIFCTCLLYFGVVYAAVFLTNSIVLALLAIMLYTLALTVLPPETPNFILYFSNGPANSDLLLHIGLPQFMLGCGLSAVGVFLNLRRRRFK